MSVTTIAEFKGLYVELERNEIEPGRPWTAFVTFGKDNDEGALGFGIGRRTPHEASEAALKDAKRKLGGLTRRTRRALGKAAKR